MIPRKIFQYIIISTLIISSSSFLQKNVVRTTSFASRQLYSLKLRKSNDANEEFEMKQNLNDKVRTFKDHALEGFMSDRRQALYNGFRMMTLANIALSPKSSSAANNDIVKQSDRTYFPTITPPFTNRATFRYDLGRNTYALEQLLQFSNVTATIRTTVVQLNDQNDLWVNSPLYPTKEYCKLLDELGTVKHVVLPVNALEHKAQMKAFIEKYKSTIESVWVAPGQYGPFGSCGLSLLDKKNMGYKIDGIFPKDSPSSEISNNNKETKPVWADDFEYRTLYADLPENAGPVSEVAFLHKPSKTLITTDAVVFIPSTKDVDLTIFNTVFDPAVVSTPGFWEKSVLQAVFLPLRTNNQISSSGGDDESNNIIYPGYEAIQNRIVRAPILRAFADARAPVEVKRWVQSILQMGDFDRIVTSHFTSPISLSAKEEFALAFQYLFTDEEVRELKKGVSTSVSSLELPPIACKDWDLLNSLNTFIDDNKLGAPVIFDFRKGCQV